MNDKIREVEAALDGKTLYKEKLFGVIDADLNEICRDKRGIIDLYEDKFVAEVTKNSYDDGPGRNAGFYVAEVTLTWERE